MADLDLALHSLHPYPCKFPAAVARAYIDKGRSVLDPYCGSGTTLLEAAVKGMNVYGFDCNPIAKLITECKLSNLTAENFKSLEKLASLINSNSFIRKIGDYELHEFDGKDHWFTQQAQAEFGLLLNELNKFERNTPPWLVVATTLSAITNTYSNQDSETRYAAIEKNHITGDVTKAFGKKLIKSIDAIRLRGPIKNKVSQVSLGDIREGMPMADGSIDQVITSPPYANTMDYYLYHKHRMNLLKFDFKQTQNREIGSRYEFSSRRQKKEVWSADYKLGMIEIMRVLKPGGKAIFVIGDSQIAGELINGGEMTVDAATSLGLTSKILESVSMAGKSRTFRHSFQSPNKYEHVVEIRK